jgi:hypothetical protein
MTGYPLGRIYEEVAFLAYYLHWSHEEIMLLDHGERRKWCEEVSKINTRISGERQEKSLADFA